MKAFLFIIFDPAHAPEFSRCALPRRGFFLFPSANEKRVAAQAKLIEQNAAVQNLGAEKRAADERRQVAEKFAAAAIARARSRGGAVAASQAPDCDGVMGEAWGSWK